MRARGIILGKLGHCGLWQSSNRVRTGASCRKNRTERQKVKSDFSFTDPDKKQFETTHKANETREREREVKRKTHKFLRPVRLPSERVSEKDVSYSER